ncbi:hypothetical protein JCM1841_002959 [Sporobolomyces salmonicolor]
MEFHPLLDRLEATSAPPSLRTSAESVLRQYWSTVHDVGDTPYELLANVLKLSSAQQLAELEANSPHLTSATNDIWRDLCIHDFVDVRIMIEDGRMSRRDEPSSWKERYAEEETKREAKMEAILNKLRGQYKVHASDRASKSIQAVDGLRLEKRRKTSHGGSSSKPKTLFEKARSSTKAITSMYTPRRRPVQRNATTSSSSMFPSSRPAPTTSATPDISRPLTPKLAVPIPSAKRPAITTVTRPLKRPASSTALSPPPSVPLKAASPPHPTSSAFASSSRHISFSPPPQPPRPISHLPMRARPGPPAPPPPPSAAKSASPPPSSQQTTSSRPPAPPFSPPNGAATGRGPGLINSPQPSQRAIKGLFMPKRK